MACLHTPVRFEFEKDLPTSACRPPDPCSVEKMHICVNEAAALKGTLRHWKTVRSSSQLESYHKRSNRVLACGGTKSAKLSGHLLSIFDHCNNIRAGVTNKGDTDFGMYDHQLLDAVKVLYADRGWADPLPLYKGLPAGYTSNERFGVDAVRVPGVLGDDGQFTPEGE